MVLPVGIMAEKEEEEETLEDKLSYSPENIWEDTDEEEMDEIFDFVSDYKEFISEAKTERECVSWSVDKLEEEGFKEIDEYDELSPGDKVYITSKDKTVVMAIIGENDLREGCNIVASHIDAPRLDLKPRPLYEETEDSLALLQTHYYGGIKKYQWVNTPMAIHGTVAKENGENVEIKLGEKMDEPAFIVSDLLPHLSKKKQGKRKMKDVIKGEELNILVGGIPIDDDDIEKKVKTKVLKLLNDEYGIKEEDLVSAELEMVPAGPARDIGFDRSMLGAYAQDDRISAYTSFRAALEMDTPERTAMVAFFDKEEIGSEGNTGAKSDLLPSVFSKLLNKTVGDYSIEDRRQMLDNSKAISADVNPAVNPSFKSVHEPQNAARLGKGIVLTKYTGAGGKYSGNDAHAEYVAFIRKILNEKDIEWQPGELGKVDEGGGGTVAKFLSNLNIEVLDAGTPLIGMHSPMEVVSKADVYNSKEAYKAFLEAE